MNFLSLAHHALRFVNPERAHHLTIAALKAGLGPRQGEADPASLAIDIFGLHFPNPIGIAAGFDKNGEVLDAIFNMGMGFVEVGTVTPYSQLGNLKPRIFRLESERGIINHLGFNNEGYDVLKCRLEDRRSLGGIVGINIGANKDTVDRIADYESGITAFADLASYFAVNISSPNTPNLRALQKKGVLEVLVDRLLQVRIGCTPILLKIDPDLSVSELSNIAAIALEMRIDGLIVSNTTIKREGLTLNAHAYEVGGLSGRPLFSLSTKILRDIYRLTKGKIPIIGVGGIASGADAYVKIRCGASLVQLYSALTYEGPALIASIKNDLAAALSYDGFSCVADAVGIDARNW